MIHSPDDRSRPAVAYQWASQVISIALEMVVPGLVGYWLDQRLGTVAVLTVLGFAFGFTLGMVQLVQLGRSRDKPGPSGKPPAE